MRAFSVVLAVLATACMVAAQVPIPSRPDGFPIGGPVTAPVHMDVFVDLLCPDCADAWANVKDVVDHYGKNLSFTMHTFPLPYHTYGFMVANAYHVVLKKDASKARAVADLIFAKQAGFWNKPTASLTSTAVQAQLGDLLVNGGFISAADFASGMADSSIYYDAVISWKYACSRNVVGTPTFLVNGVFVDAQPSWTLSEWQQVLDPLFGSSSQATLADEPALVLSAGPLPKATQPKCARRAFSSRHFVANLADCPPDRPACQYLPGKVECCRAGEGCIPNVGCRC